jgi:5-methylcytosine-specific restriction endonuclease McrA
MSVYTTEAWRRRRQSFLKRHPRCIRCGDLATEVDHIVPRRILVALEIHDPDADQFLQPLCGSDHARKTRTVDQLILRRWEQGEDPQALAEEAMG